MEKPFFNMNETKKKDRFSYFNEKYVKCMNNPEKERFFFKEHKNAIE